LRLVVAITGASGVIYGIRTLEVLSRLKIDTHLIITEWGGKNIKIETDKTGDYVKSLATRCYEDDNMAAPVSSGSFKVDGMIVIPCSTKTLASIANALDDSLVKSSRRLHKGTAQTCSGSKRDSAVKDTPRKHGQACKYQRSSNSARHARILS
jgi:polyprenyl P-hydroxybenzoate/phenylacrylic acid decarboxylase-like protein